MLGFLFFSTTVVPINADYVVIDWGDVVKLKITLNYAKPRETKSFLFDGYVELYLGDSVPPDINQSYRRVKPMFLAFRQQVIGMKEGEEREFTLNYKDAGITNTSDIVYGADLFYKAVFLEMLYDVNKDPIFELTWTHPLILIPAAGIIILIYISYNNGYLSKGYQWLVRRSKPTCISCGIRTKQHCASLECRKPICRSCFAENRGCPSCEGKKLTGSK